VAVVLASRLTSLNCITASLSRDFFEIAPARSNPKRRLLDVLRSNHKMSFALSTVNVDCAIHQILAVFQGLLK